jgi:hypothetical protein
MIQGIEMERVVITLLAFLNPPIDWVPMGVILRNRRWGSMDELVKLVAPHSVLRHAWMLWAWGQVSGGSRGRFYPNSTNLTLPFVLA